MKKEILNINNLSIGYGKGKRTKIVHNKLNGSLYAGELLCLLGENGTGKSTLIRTICGFQSAYGGEAILMGENLLQLSERELAKMAAVVLTDRVVVPNATVEELVSLGRSPYTGTFGILNDEDKTVVHSAIEKCGILHKKYERLSNMSDGEKQKAFIAKALAQDTPVIILDEPTAFLDMPARVEIIHLLRQIANTAGKSVLMSTHDLDLALQMADRLWLLSSGKKLLSGSPEDLLLRNEFQSIFETRGIEFDNRTGLFRVDYDYEKSIAVEGHGFEYVLLRRAFARKGIRTVRKAGDEKRWVEISKNGETTFSVKENGKEVFSEQSVEKLITVLTN